MLGHRRAVSKGDDAPPPSKAPKAGAGGRRAALGDISNNVQQNNQTEGGKENGVRQGYVTRSKARAAAASASCAPVPLQQQQQSNSSTIPAAVQKQAAPAPVPAPAHSVRPTREGKQGPRGFASESNTSGSQDGRVPSLQRANDIDERDRREPLAVTEYVEDLYSYLRTAEVEYAVSPDAIERQPHVNARMFAILVDWLVEVHLRFRLVPDTLYLTVYIIVRYLELETVTRANLQLVGVTALLVAAKYEEIYPPEVRDLVYMTDRAYTKEQILEMETEMLNRLSFKVTVPTTYCFLLRYLKAAHADRRIVQLSCYVAERMLQETRMLRHLPSLTASAAIYIARRNLNRNPWSPTLAKYTGLGEADLVPVLRDMAALMTAPTDLRAVKCKFATKQFGAVAGMDIDMTLDPALAAAEAAAAMAVEDAPEADDADAEADALPAAAAAPSSAKSSERRRRSSGARSDGAADMSIDTAMDDSI